MTFLFTAGQSAVVSVSSKGRPFTSEMAMHPDQLMELIRRYAGRSRESLQVSERLKSLLPQVLAEAKRETRGRWKGAEAERHALNDPAYLEKVQEYVELHRNGLEARIQFETHRMLLQAWQSLNSMNRVQVKARSEAETKAKSRSVDAPHPTRSR